MEETNMTRQTGKMKRREFLKLGMAGAAATGLGTAFAGTPAAAQAKLVLKASDVHPTGYPTVAAVEAMGKKLEAATSGRISIQMYPSMQLGGEKEMIEQAQVGALQIARVSVGAIGPVVDDLNVFNMPFVFRDGAHMEKVIDGEIGSELLTKITSNEKTGLIGLCWMNAGTRNVYNAKRPIKSLEDLKGLKIRMMGNPLFVDTMNALGGNGIAMGFDQLYNAMQTGVVDGAENNFPTFIAQNHFQVAKYFSQTEHLIIPEILVFSKKSWDAMSKEDQALIAKVGKEAQTEQRTLWYKAEEESLAKMKAAGIEIIKFADKKAFQDAVKPVWDKYGAKYAALTKRIQDVK
jgi:tripartite ATP-independent transporter DctP family solute receptor